MSRFCCVMQHRNTLTHFLYGKWMCYVDGSLSQHNNTNCRWTLSTRISSLRFRSTTATKDDDMTKFIRPYIENNASTTHFGYQQVPISEKEQHVKHVFENVANSYDVMNDLMSGGLHRAWKDYLIQVSQIETIASVVRRIHTSQHQQQHQQPIGTSETINLQQGSTFQILDVAGGTGDIAFRFLDIAGCIERSKSSGIDPIQITVCDINTEMLRVGEQRATQFYGRNVMDQTRALQFMEGNAQNLYQFTDNTFDIYTIAFGLRNVTNVDLGLQEAYRVLKPGGRFMCLEFSQVPNHYLRTIYDSYSFHIIPTIGEVVANDRHSYQYLVESIRKFPNQEELTHRMNQVGFQMSKYTNLTGGIVALHEGWKPI
jgi:ubiquinone/menaquinone biosynthesis methyltransferase